MSTDPEATPNLPASSPVGQPPGALALLTATALGGIVASRLPKAPLVVAAGVTALALLKPRKAPAQPPSPSPPFPPAPPAESLAHDPVGDWLRQQIEREAAAPAVAWPPIDEEAAVPAADDDYTPPSFLLDDEAQVHRPAAHDVFASLTEPLDFPMRLAPSIAAENESEAAEPSPDALASSPDLSVDDASSASEVVLPIEPGAEGTTLPTHFPSSFVWPATTALQPDSAATSALFAPPPAALAAETNPEPVVSPPAVAKSVEPTSSDIHDTRSAPESPNAAWLLGIEPIPSLGESSPPAFPEPSSLFTDIAPARPVFTTGLFQGASLPDEIEVPPHPPQPEPPAPLPPPSPPTPEPPTPVPPIPEPPVPAPVPHLMPVFPGTSACENESSAMRWHPGPSIASSDHPFVIHTHHNLEAPGTNGAFPHSPPPLEAPTSDPVLEIPVHLAAPGEASFDPPPLDIAQDFWHSTDGTSAAEPTAAGAESPASPSSPLLSGPVIDAEIVLRPRGLPQNTVTSRTKPLAPVSTTPPSPSAPAIESANASNPLPPPRDKRPRSTWRSWWRGD